jgi:hypothetical protein
MGRFIVRRGREICVGFNITASLYVRGLSRSTKWVEVRIRIQII